jgi:YD repeat-containing protein
LAARLALRQSLRPPNSRPNYQRNDKGHPTFERTTYTTTGGSWSTRSRTLTYAANGIDLLTERNFSGLTVRTYTYDNAHRVLTMTEHPQSGVSHVTTYTYDSYGRLKTWQTPAGLTRTYNYGGSGYLSSFTESPFARSEFFTWLNQQPRTHTDARGLTRTFTFDKLGRLTRIDYPDATHRAFRCTADDTTVSYEYNLLGQFIAETDALGSRTFGYNNQGLRTTNQTAFGQTQRIVYNINNQPTSVTDANGVTTTQSFDRLDRVLTRSAPDAGVERFLYTARGLVAHTNQLNEVWRFEYDAVGNLTNVVYASSPAITNRYDALNRLTNMVDAAGVHHYTYHLNGQLLTEDGPWANDTVTYGYNNARLRSSLSLQQPATTNLWTNGFLYDAARRLSRVTSPAGAYPTPTVARGRS